MFNTNLGKDVSLKNYLFSIKNNKRKKNSQGDPKMTVSIK